MAVTRAKATSLLNATEMGLYDDSRANALRGHSEAKLARLVTRARTARDRARDLEKRQRLASRSTTGSKSGRSGQANARTGEKAELLADILKRLEAQHRDTAKAEKAAGRDKAKAAKSAATAKAKTATAAKRATGKKAASKTTRSGKVASGAKTASASTSAKKPAKKAAAKQASSKATSAAAGKAPAKGASKTAAARKDATEKGAAKKGAAKSAGISPKRALANTRKLLAEQDAKAAQPKPWDGLGNDGTAQAAPGFQSPKARSRALELHAGETRQAPIHGSISTRDRKNQGKRDHRSK
mgnify:CR=1 FL=1